LQERIELVGCNAERNLAFSPSNYLVTAVSGLTAGMEILFNFLSRTDKINTIHKNAESEDSHISGGKKK